eukprot:2619041-Rhodomonas_salina.1
MLSAAEFDRGMAQRQGTALGKFAECGLSSEELFGTHALREQERLASMVTHAEGRRCLDLLAAKVVQHFGLDSSQPDQV